MTKGNKRGKAGHPNWGCRPLTADAGCGQHLAQHKRLAWASGMSTLKPWTKGWWKCFDCYSQAGSWCIICLFWIEDCSDKMMNQNTSKHCTLSPVPTLKIIPYPRTGCRTIRLPVFLITNGSLTTFRAPKSSAPQAGTSVIGSISISF